MAADGSVIIDTRLDTTGVIRRAWKHSKKNRTTYRRSICCW